MTNLLARLRSNQPLTEAEICDLVHSIDVRRRLPADVEGNEASETTGRIDELAQMLRQQPDLRLQNSGWKLHRGWLR